MAKYKYNLSYIENGEIIPIRKLHEVFVECPLDNIDGFTSLFNSEIELINFLKLTNVIPTTVNKLYVSHNKVVNDKVIQNIINDGDILIFNKDKNKLNEDYIYAMFNKLTRLENNDNLRILCDLYIKKYTVPNDKKNEKRCTHFNRMVNVLNNMYMYTINRINYVYDTGAYLEDSKFNKNLNDFIEKEFFSKTKQGKTLRYRNLRDFIIKLKYVTGEYNIDRRHDYLDYNINDEEKIYTLKPDKKV